MGEIADSIINGEFCQGCGEYLGDACGYPRYCSSCAPQRTSTQNKLQKHNGYVACKSLLFSWKKAATLDEVSNTIKNYALHREWKETNPGTIAKKLRDEHGGWKLFKIWVKSLPDVERRI